MESQDADRSGITLRDHVDAVAGLIDSLSPAGGKVVLAGHSGGGAIAHGAADARPDRVARVIYVDSVPLGDGGVINDDLPAENGEVPLPEWSFFDDEDLVGLDEGLRATFRERGRVRGPAHRTLAAVHQAAGSGPGDRGSGRSGLTASLPEEPRRLSGGAPGRARRRAGWPRRAPRHGSRA